MGPALRRRDRMATYLGAIARRRRRRRTAALGLRNAPPSHNAILPNFGGYVSKLSDGRTQTVAICGSIAVLRGRRDLPG
jgi:hypothetical protein